MKEHPILFSGSMVRAILAGRKTMTRRVVNPQPEDGTDCPYYVGVANDRKARVCPYGSKGTRLWVRETFFNSRGDDSMPTHYRADENDEDFQLKWKPSIFMPRWASRITLEIESVRIERLHDISEDEAKAEGTEDSEIGIAHRTCFHILWDSINKKRGFGWSENPWVWVIQFHRL